MPWPKHQAIKVREKIINKNIDNVEIRNQTPTQINEDVEAINQLLLQNRETIARLQQSANQLKKANINIANMEKLIAQLRQQVETKDQEIVMLKNNLEQMHVQVAELHEQVSGLNTQGDRPFRGEGLARRRGQGSDRYSQHRLLHRRFGERIARQGDCLQKRFYRPDAEDQRERSLDSFTKVDIRHFDSVVIGQKKVTLVSSHPAGSYEFVQDEKGVYESLIIKDKRKFWDTPKFWLSVISNKNRGCDRFSGGFAL